MRPSASYSFSPQRSGQCAMPQRAQSRTHAAHSTRPRYVAGRMCRQATRAQADRQLAAAPAVRLCLWAKQLLKPAQSLPARCNNFQRALARSTRNAHPPCFDKAASARPSQKQRAVPVEVLIAVTLDYSIELTALGTANCGASPPSQSLHSHVTHRCS